MRGPPEVGRDGRQSGHSDHAAYRFKQPAGLLYAVLSVELGVSVGAAWLFGFRTASIAPFLPQLFCLMLVGCGPLLRRIKFARVAASFEAVGFVYGQGFALVALLYPMTAIAAPFADSRLAAADRALGFDWPAFAALFRNSADALHGLKIIYSSFGWQQVLIVPALVFTHRAGRAWHLILAANVALVATILIYPLAPAAGTFIHYGLTPADYPNMSARVAWVFGPAIHAIRDEHARIITKDLMVPFVSFPSYHAVAAVILTWAAWPLKYLRWPIAALNLAMAISALIIGAHYLVDVLAGVGVAALAIAIARPILATVQGFGAPPA